MTTEAEDERKFLHDIASPIGTALFLLDAIVEVSQSQALSAEDLELVKKAFDSLIRVKELLHDRRSTLLAREDSRVL